MRWNNQHLQIDKRHEALALAGKQVRVKQKRDGTLLVEHAGQLLDCRLVISRPEPPRGKKPEIENNKTWTPPATRPWKQGLPPVAAAKGVTFSLRYNRKHARLIREPGCTPGILKLRFIHRVLDDQMLCGSAGLVHNARVPRMFDLQRLRRDLKPYRLHWFPRLRSTNDHAATLRKRGDLFAPAIVLTGHQLAGRGRGSNTWWSGDGSLTVTFVLPGDEHLAPHHVPLIAGLAVRNAAAQLANNQEIQIKWPNDLLYKNRKLAGLLCERVHKADLIGVGLNVNIDRSKVPAALRDRVTSLNWIRDEPIDATSAVIALANQLYQMLSNRDDQSFAAVIREYDQHHALRGRRVTVTQSADEPTIIGKCEGLDDTGRMLLRDRKTLHRVIAGHVQLM